jgi:hypothetical protein
MRRAQILAAVAALAGALAGPARADDSMRCARGIVGIGDLTVDLLGKCGPPSLRDRWTDTRDAVAVDFQRQLAATERITTEVEQWTYDFGRNHFLQVVTVQNGRIVRIERGGYGHGLPPASAPGQPLVSSCDPSLLHEGDTKADALARCGSPASSSSWQEPRTTAVVVQGGLVPPGGSSVRVELWVYNLGPNHFLRLVRFEDGRVVRVETGGYGYPD